LLLSTLLRDPHRVPEIAVATHFDQAMQLIRRHDPQLLAG
jgi:hypothetical protein